MRKKTAMYRLQTAAKSDDFAEDAQYVLTGAEVREVVRLYEEAETHAAGQCLDTENTRIRDLIIESNAIRAERDALAKRINGERACLNEVARRLGIDEEDKRARVVQAVTALQKRVEELEAELRGSTEGYRSRIQDLIAELNDLRVERDALDAGLRAQTAERDALAKRVEELERDLFELQTEAAARDLEWEDAVARQRKRIEELEAYLVDERRRIASMDAIILEQHRRLRTRPVVTEAMRAFLDSTRLKPESWLVIAYHTGPGIPVVYLTLGDLRALANTQAPAADTQGSASKHTSSNSPASPDGSAVTDDELVSLISQTTGTRNGARRVVELLRQSGVCIARSTSDSAASHVKGGVHPATRAVLDAVVHWYDTEGGSAEEGHAESVLLDAAIYWIEADAPDLAESPNDAGDEESPEEWRRRWNERPTWAVLAEGGRMAAMDKSEILDAIDERVRMEKQR